jgi:hypothetical protein
MADPATSDWTVKAVDTLDGVVGLVKERAVDPITTGTRAVVFGLLIAIVATMSMVLVAAAAVRLVDVYTGAGRVWIAHVSIGGLFAILGVFAWSRRTKRDAD